MQILSTLLPVTRRLSVQSYEKFLTPPNNTTTKLLLYLYFSFGDYSLEF